MKITFREEEINNVVSIIQHLLNIKFIAKMKLYTIYVNDDKLQSVYILEDVVKCQEDSDTYNTFVIEHIKKYITTLSEIRIEMNL